MERITSPFYGFTGASTRRCSGKFGNNRHVFDGSKANFDLRLCTACDAEHILLKIT